MHRGIVVIFILASAILSLPDTAFAQEDPQTTLGDAVATFEEMRVQFDDNIELILASDDYSGFVEILFAFIVVTILFLMVLEGVFEGFDLAVILTLVIMILIVRLLIENYDSLTDAMWGWAIGFGGVVQQTVLGSSDFNAPLEFMWNTIGSIETGEFNIITKFGFWLTSFVVTLFVVVLSALSVITLYWSLWGFAVAKIIGLMFLPTLLWQRVSWLFDGWLRFFFGFLMFSVIARINITLITLVIANFIGVSPLGDPNAIPGISTEGLTINDAIGLLIVLGIGILGLIMTGRFVGMVIGGGSFGFGFALFAFSRTISGRVLK